ncbi:hypothetical protein E2320_011810 [Naja naja]|nr:hypothetical protein E2320_011810 [Naja naja]
MQGDDFFFLVWFGGAFSQYFETTRVQNEFAGSSKNNDAWFFSSAPFLLLLSPPTSWPSSDFRKAHSSLRILGNARLCNRPCPLLGWLFSSVGLFLRKLVWLTDTTSEFSMASQKSCPVCEDSQAGIPPKAPRSIVLRLVSLLRCSDRGEIPILPRDWHFSTALGLQDRSFKSSALNLSQLHACGSVAAREALFFPKTFLYWSQDNDYGVFAPACLVGKGRQLQSRRRFFEEQSPLLIPRLYFISTQD